MARPLLTLSPFFSFFFLVVSLDVLIVLFLQIPLSLFLSLFNSL